MTWTLHPRWQNKGGTFWNQVWLISGSAISTNSGWNIAIAKIGYFLMDSTKLGWFLFKFPTRWLKKSSFNQVWVIFATRWLNFSTKFRWFLFDFLLGDWKNQVSTKFGCFKSTSFGWFLKFIPNLGDFKPCQLQMISLCVQIYPKLINLGWSVYREILAAIKNLANGQNCLDKYLANLKFGDLHGRIEVMM